MSSYEDRCVKIGVVFHAFYFENEVSDPPIFLHFRHGNSLSDCSQSIKKICVVEVFCTNVLKRGCKAILGNSAFFARNCLTSTFKYIVMQNRKGNSEKGF